MVDDKHIEDVRTNMKFKSRQKTDAQLAQESRSRKVWRHCSYFGNAKMAEQFYASLLDSDTVTQDAKNIASECLEWNRLLRDALMTRVDDGKEVYPAIHTTPT